MGLCKTIFYAILGPLLIWNFFVGQLACRLFFQSTSPIAVKDWPAGTSQEQKDNVILRRKVFIKDTMDMYMGKYKDDYVKNWCTPDIEVEDPLEKFVGQEEVRSFLTAMLRHLVSNEITLNKEYHGQGEVVLDWTMTMTMDFMPSYPVTIPMRTHLMLSRPTKTGGYEKANRIFEEWFGARLLEEGTTVPFLGRIHERMRRFAGTMVIGLINNGYF